MSVFDDPAFFGEVWADLYDEGVDLDPAPAVEFLAETAGGGRVLELAIGTGRVGVPLAARGVHVEGVEGSRKMVAKMRAKPGGEHIPVTIGDMADVPVEGPYRLVFLVYNTLFNILDPDRQALLFANVARVLSDDGAFVVECYVPDPSRFDQGRGAGKGRVEALEVTEDSATIEVYSFDAAAQRFLSQKITFGADGVRLRPHAERFCRPEEMDTMAEQAGLVLSERYQDWGRAPFGPHSAGHVSVYRPAPAPREQSGGSA
ncbi:class I SAM-dependent DNA methyltransferase [Nocardiopsis baichengensis]|uniref:class I SAM-dependent DNA methyltransferase n=1 Tax=Nocardiopsis baichengensis TaxID=280240 RepID=UPI000346DEDE|nr:class I SAM-dependent methyltransferase [Nocardiopsis baichengensis]